PCELFRKRLDEIDMAAPDHETDGVENQVVGKDRAHVVRVRAAAPHQRLDIEDDALADGALEIISADLSGDDKVAHEHAVEFALLVASANNPSRQQPPIDLRRSVWVRSLARDQITDENDGGRIDRASPVVGVTKRAAESEDIWAHKQE